MAKKSRYGILECEHDTPTNLHDALWNVYNQHVGPGKLQVIAGPFHKEIMIQMGRTRIVGWVIIDLEAIGDTRPNWVKKAETLRVELEAADPTGGVEARFYELADSTPT